MFYLNIEAILAAKRQRLSATGKQSGNGPAVVATSLQQHAALTV